MSKQMQCHGGQMGIFGCRFSLYPMDSDFVPIILGALEKTDTSAVWSASDALSTVYRGGLDNVVDAVAALLLNAWREDCHMVLEGQFSEGCPGDVTADLPKSLDPSCPNRESIGEIHFPVSCKLALYPMGTKDYMPLILQVKGMAEEHGLRLNHIHYATRVDGDVQQVFSYLEAVCKLSREHASHYALHFTISMNSPTEE